MPRVKIFSAALLGAAAFALPAAPASAQCSDYSCADYAQHDLDNYTRARGRMVKEATSPEYHQKFAGACVDSQSRALAKQIEDVDDGRVYGGVGQATCWWSVGDAADYNKVRPRRITFLSRTGAKLQGHIWDNGAKGPRPGVVVTTGSIQASEQMYWWAARAMAAKGYVVLTYDVQGQGQSETGGHAPGDIFPTADGVPSQQDANFYDGTVDALRFFLSTGEKPYVPQGWSKDDVAAAKAGGDGDELSWSSPAEGALDEDRLAIIGHSLGASAVSHVQMCSDEARVWKKAEVCAGQSFPIKAVIAWDALSGADTVTPVVPAMSQQADGYFLFPTLSPTAPDPESSLGGFARWDKAGVDVFSYVVRGGTHIDWSQVPYTSSPAYSPAMNTYYTLAWLDRWVARSPKTRKAGLDALLAGPKGKGPGNASLMSARRFSAMSLGDLRTTDLRRWGGRSAVGDFAGANADTEGRVLP